MPYSFLAGLFMGAFAIVNPKIGFLLLLAAFAVALSKNMAVRLFDKLNLT